MLKNLVKHGNSTVLVLDKAILALLNMDESSVVKLQTDGKSLIMTPVRTQTKKQFSDPISDPMKDLNIAIKAIEAKRPRHDVSLELMAEMKEAYAKVFAKHGGLMATFPQSMASNKEFQRAIDLIAKKHDPATQPEKYTEEFLKLKTQFFPELTELDKEIAEIKEKYKNI